MKKKRISFNKKFDYLHAYCDDLRSLIAYIFTTLQIGDSLVMNNKSFFVDKTLFELENCLHVLSGAILCKMSLFGFKWNECFKKTYGLNVNGKNNWFYWADDINNDEKHIDKVIENFFIPNFEYDETEVEKHNKKVLPLLIKGRKNIKDFKDWLDSDIEFRRKTLFEKNQKFKTWVNKHFNISSHKEYIELRGKYFPTFNPYLTELIYKHKNKSDTFIGVINFLVMMINTKSTISNKVKEHLVIKPWISFKKSLDNVRYFLLFVYFQLKKCNFNEIDKFNKSEFPSKLLNIWDWYENEKDFFIFWFNKNVKSI